MAAVLTVILTCTPIQSFWDPTIAGSHCINYNFTLHFYATVNVVTDAAILILPMPFVWRMKTNLHRKIQISSIFLLGSLVTIVSVLRAYYTGIMVVAIKTDASWDTAYLCIWASAETGIGIVAACLPVMRPVLNKVLYGSVEGCSARSKSSGLSAPSSDGGSSGAHLVTIGGRVVPLRSDVALSGGDAGPQRISVVSSTVDEKPGSTGLARESV